MVDIGWRGDLHDAVPIVAGAVPIDLDTPGYDGLHLPLDDGWADTLHASHVLEHVPDDIAALREWFRVIREGGTLILMVPHAYLYERRVTVPPSRWSGEHLRCYTSGSLLTAIEQALTPNTWRLRTLAEDDTGYDYTLSPEQHPQGCYEIVCVIEKIAPPAWPVEP